ARRKPACLFVRPREGARNPVQQASSRSAILSRPGRGELSSRHRELIPNPAEPFTSVIARGKAPKQSRSCKCMRKQQVALDRHGGLAASRRFWTRRLKHATGFGMRLRLAKPRLLRAKTAA